MEVYLVVILQGHIGRVKALFLERIGSHDAGGNRFFYLCVELLQGADALFLLAVFRAPDGQRRAPVAAAAQVPVLDVLQPLAKAARTGGSGFPGDGLVQGHHLILHGAGLDEPAVQRVVQHGKVCAPAVRITVHMLLHLERTAVGLHHHAKVNIQRAFLLHVLEILLIAGLYISAGIFLIRRIYRSGVGGFHVFQAHEAALTVHLGLRIAVLVQRHDGADAGSRSYPFIVRTKCRGDMDDTRTVGGGYVVTGDNTEGVSVRFEPRDELMVTHANELRALPAAAQQFPGNHLVPCLEAFQRNILSLGIEPGAHQVLGQHIDGRLPGIRVEGKHTHIFNLRAHAQRRVGRKRPGRSGPGQEIHREGIGAEQRLGSAVLDNLELHRSGGVAHILVAARLVELMRAEAGAVCRRIRLNGVALVEQPFVVNFLQEIPQGFNVAVVVGDVRVCHIYPISYALGHVHPLFGIFHHLRAAGGVVFFYRYFGADIRLGDTQLLFHAQFYGQAVGIPTGTAFDLKAGLGLVSANGILDGAGHHMVNARHAVGTGRPFKKDKLRGTLTKLQGLFERLAPFPSFQHLTAGFR